MLDSSDSCWTYTEIQIQMTDATTRDVVALASGPWAIHEAVHLDTVRGTLALTHIPTGCAFRATEHGVRLDLILSLVSALEAYFPRSWWESVEAPEAIDGHQVNLRKIAESVLGAAREAS